MPALRRISGELSLPEPAKSRILLEIAGDLEALFDHYRRGGLEEDEAAMRAEQKLLASPEVLQKLIVVHTTGYERWVARAVGGLRWSFELFLFVVAVVPLLGAPVVVVAGQIQNAPLTPLLGAVLGLGGGMAGIGVWKAHQIFVRRERSSDRLNRGLVPVLLLGLFGLLLGALGFLIGLVRTSVLLSTGGRERRVQLAWLEIVEGGTLFTLGILLAIGAALIWFVLVNRIAAIEQEESAALLAS